MSTFTSEKFGLKFAAVTVTLLSTERSAVLNVLVDAILPQGCLAFRFKFFRGSWVDCLYEQSQKSHKAIIYGFTFEGSAIVPASQRGNQWFEDEACMMQMGSAEGLCSQ